MRRLLTTARYEGVEMSDTHTRVLVGGSPVCSRLRGNAGKHRRGGEEEKDVKGTRLATRRARMVWACGTQNQWVEVSKLSVVAF